MMEEMIMLEKEEEIKHIQNTIWMMYKAYLKDHDMKEYNRKMKELVTEYCDKKDKLLLSFCKNLLIAWAPIISEFAKEFNGKGKDADV